MAYRAGSAGGLVNAGLYPSRAPTAGQVAVVRVEVEAWVRDRVAARDQHREPADNPVLVATADKRGPHWLSRAYRGRAAAREEKHNLTTDPDADQIPASLAVPPPPPVVPGPVWTLTRPRPPDYGTHQPKLSLRRLRQEEPPSWRGRERTPSMRIPAMRQEAPHRPERLFPRPSLQAACCWATDDRGIEQQQRSIAMTWSESSAPSQSLSYPSRSGHAQRPVSPHPISTARQPKPLPAFGRRRCTSAPRWRWAACSAPRSAR